MNNLVELDNVTKRYSPADASPPVLRELSLAAPSGQSMAIVGVSGSGKTTLLNLIGLLDRPDSGRVLLSGQDVSTLDDLALAGLRNQQIGFVFQAHHLLPQLTVLENVLLPVLATTSTVPSATIDRARQLLDRVGLSHRTDYRPGQLSGGEQQRAAVVRALINRPQLLLADEPTGSLDRASAESLAQLLADLHRQDGLTMIVVTHSTELARRMERAYELRDGRLHPLPAEGTARP